MSELLRELEIRPLIARPNGRRPVLRLSDGSDHELTLFERFAYALDLTDERKLEKKRLRRRKKQASG